MATIVSVRAGEKGRLLCDLWSRIGHHETSDKVSDLEDASVVLFGGAMSEAQGRLGPRLAGKILVDCSNPSDLSTLRMPVSRAEALAQIYPDARVVKAFNTITVAALGFVASHRGPEIGTVYTSAFYCGDDVEAKGVVAGLSAEINLDPIDCGPLSNAVLLESLGLLGTYLQANVFDSEFALCVVRPPKDRSPLDRWM